MSIQEKITAEIINKISNLLRDTLNRDFDLHIGNMELAPTSKLLIEEIGAIFFNAGLENARLIIGKRMLDVEDDLQCQEIIN
jgi:uncharacterized protein (DUF2164 family)